MAALVTVPLNKYIATKIGDMSAKMMRYKDQRIRVCVLLIPIPKNYDTFFS